MNLLENIRIKGEIFFEYSFFTIEFTFGGQSNAARAEYLFALPDNAQLSDMKIIKGDEVIKSKVVSAAYAAQLNGTKTAAVLRKTESGLYLLSVDGAGVGLSVRLSVYAPLKRTEDGGKLTIPLAVGESGGLGKSGAEIDITLPYIMAKKLESPTHIISVERAGRRVRVSTGRINADRDFCLEIGEIERKNAAVMVTDGLKTEMICTLYPSDRFFELCESKKKKILFIYDNTGSLVGGAASAAKEFIYASARFNAGESAVVCFDNDKEKVLVSHGSDKLIENLNTIDGTGGSPVGLIEAAADRLDGDTIPIMVTSDIPNEKELIPAAVCRYMNRSGIIIVRLGATSCRDDITKAAEECGGRTEHIFGMDNVTERAKKIIENVRLGISDAYIEAGNAETAILDLPKEKGGAVVAYINYGYGKPCKYVTVCKNGCFEKISLDLTDKFGSFAPVKLVYADALSKSIEKKMKHCSPDEVQMLKHMLESIGVKFGMVNSETVYLAEFDGIPSFVRVAIESGTAYAQNVFKGRSSMFGEASGEIPKEALSICMDVLIRSMRSDGAICTAGEISGDIRRRQTLVCVLALIASHSIDTDGEFIKAAERYLKGYKNNGMEFTKDADKAREMLKSVFGGESSEEIGVMPDLYTSAREIYLSKQPNNKLF